jgi:hypothetical protein
MILIVAAALAVAACESGPGGSPADQEVTPDYGPTAAYNRRLVFLGPGAQLPTTAVFDFVALSDSIGLRRGVRARVVNGVRWRTLIDEGWAMAPMREPWRLVPHGPIKITVTETGDLGALIHRDSVTTRLFLGATIAEHSPDVSTQLVLRSARLAVDDESVPGVLLDTQLGRSVNPQLVQRARVDTAGGAETVPPTPIGRPGAEALLLNNGGFYVVLASASGGSLAWIRNAGRDDVRSDARLEPTAWTQDEATGVQVPSAWRIVSSNGDLSGELTTESTAPITLADVQDLQALSYVLVTGWVEDRSVRRDVFGLVRHVR